MAKPSYSPVLPAAAIKRIETSVDNVFDALKRRVLGESMVGKRIYVSSVHHLSLPGLFEAAAREEGVAPNARTLHQILKVASGYIDSQREKAKARVVNEVQSFITDAHRAAEKPDVEVVLGGRLQELWSDTIAQARRIVDTEAQHTRNVGVLEGVVKVNASMGIDDPTIYFVVVRDKSLCGECKRLHMLDDGVTPRVWKLSEVGSGYHDKGDSNPKTGGLHPHCRCTIVTLLPGYGFTPAGFVTYVAKDHDEYARQRA